MKQFVLTLKSLRHRQIGLITLLFLVVVAAWLGAALAKRAGGAAETRLSVLALNEVMMLAIYVLPIIAAIVASRVVTTARDGGMDSKLRAIGVSPIRQFGANLAVTIVVTVLVAGFVLALALLASSMFGFSTPSNVVPIALSALLALVGDAIAVSAVHTWAATRFMQQGVTLGLAVVAAIGTSALPFAGFNYFSWILPWGLVSAANPVVGSTGGVVQISAAPLPAGIIAVIISLVWAAVFMLAIKIRKVEQ